MPRVAMPLASYGVLRTRSIDAARASVAASLAPHRLTALGSVGVDVLHNAAQLEHISLHYIDYGAEVEVAADGLDFQLIQIPLAGTATITAGSRTFNATPSTAVMTGAGEKVRMRYSAGNPRLMVRVAAPLLRERLAIARSTGLKVSQLPGATLDVAHGRGRSWRSLLDVLLADLEREGALATTPLAASTLELAIVDTLIASLAEDTASVVPECAANERIIRRAARLIDDHCAEPLSTPDIAEAVGLSIRALQAGFKAYLNTTPMAYVRHARLMRVRDALRDGSAVSVTDAAARWGVTHLGRLSADYRTAFGESPSETLQRSR